VKEARNPEQEEQFAAAVKTEPKSDLYQFNLAALQIRSKEGEKSTNASETLKRLRNGNCRAKPKNSGYALKKIHRCAVRLSTIFASSTPRTNHEAVRSSPTSS
jgi:hypothetical protein